MMIESLERRQLLSASACVLPCGVLLVRADNSGDNLQIIENAHGVDHNNMPANRLVQVFQETGLDADGNPVFANVGGLFTHVNKIVVLGGNGADSITVNTQDVGSYIDGGNGDDALTVAVNPDDFDPQTATFVLHPEYTGGCNEIFGGNGDDTIFATGVRDTQVSGGNGADRINVSAVASVSAANSGKLVGGQDILITGDNGDDVLVATHVSCSIISGDNGNDTIVVTDSTYTLILGGNGSDNISENGGSHDAIDAGSGTDIVSVFSSNGDIIVQSRGGDIVTVSP